MSPTRRRGALASLVAVATLGAGLALLPPPGHTAQGKDSLEGVWRVTLLTEGGKVNASEEVQLLTLTFKGDKVTLSIAGEADQGTFKTDPSKDPKQFDMKLKGKQVAGIYRLEKDELTLCFSEGGARPTRFETSARTTGLLILKRGAIKLDDAAQKRLAEKFKFDATKAQSENNLKQMALALHNYHDSYKHLPLAAIYSQDGKPLLSWRVTILPFVDGGEVYKEFKLDEPWDSEHNKKLLEKMPKLYEPLRGKAKEPHSTYYQVFTGPDTPFDGRNKLRLGAGFPDGTSNTILIIEAGEAVPWTKPADIAYDPKKPLPRLGGLFEQGLNMAMADGSVMWVNRRFDERILRAAITPAGGEIIDLDKLSK